MRRQLLITMCWSALVYISCTQQAGESRTGDPKNSAVAENAGPDSVRRDEDLDCDADTCSCPGGVLSFTAFPTPDFKRYDNWKRTADSNGFISRIAVGESEGRGGITVKITCNTDDNITLIEILKHGLTVQRFTEPFVFTDRMKIYPAEYADLNGDKVRDIKISVSGGGNGVAAMYTRDIYLLSAAPGKFVKHSFGNMHGYDRSSDFDVDGDGTFEIVHRSLVYRGARRYFCYNLFNPDTRMTSASLKNGFPLLVQERGYINKCITRHMTRDSMKRYGLSKPPEYDVCR